MTFFEESLGLNTLLLDQNNPRFPPTSSQSEAINQMLDMIPEKLIKIAEDIAVRNLNPTVKILVYSGPNGNIVKDGNRRVTAIKLLMNPKLANNKKYRNRFEKISTNIQRSDFKYIPCVVSDDEEEIDQWVQLNHQSNNSGIGHENWSSISKMRDQRNHGEIVPALELYEMVKDHFIELKDDDFPITTFQRVIQNSDFKKRTGLKIDNGTISFDMPEETFKAGISKIIEDLIDENCEDHIDSRSINDTEGLKIYLDKLSSKGFFKPGESSTINIENVPRVKTQTDKISKTTKKRQNTLIPKEIDWNIDNVRIDDLYRELKTISVQAHPNTVSVLFRVFMETSSKWYADKHGIEKIHLDERLKAIAKDLRTKGKISEDAKRSVDITTTHEDPTVAFNQELNQYGHNYELNPSPESLVANFNSVKSLLEAIFLVMSSKEE
mgnify:CR=1 FL=1